MAPSLAAQSLNHWTAREVPKHLLLLNPLWDRPQYSQNAGSARGPQGRGAKNSADDEDPPCHTDWPPGPPLPASLALPLRPVEACLLWPGSQHAWSLSPHQSGGETLPPGRPRSGSQESPGREGRLGTSEACWGRGSVTIEGLQGSGPQGPVGSSDHSWPRAPTLKEAVVSPQAEPAVPHVEGIHHDGQQLAVLQAPRQDLHDERLLLGAQCLEEKQPGEGAAASRCGVPSAPQWGAPGQPSDPAGPPPGVGPWAETVRGAEMEINTENDPEGKALCDSAHVRSQIPRTGSRKVCGV